MNDINQQAFYYFAFPLLFTSKAKLNLHEPFSSVSRNCDRKIYTSQFALLFTNLRFLRIKVALAKGTGKVMMEFSLYFLHFTLYLNFYFVKEIFCVYGTEYNEHFYVGISFFFYTMSYFITGSSSLFLPCNILLACFFSLFV